MYIIRKIRAIRAIRVIRAIRAIRSVKCSKLLGLIKPAAAIIVALSFIAGGLGAGVGMDTGVGMGAGVGMDAGVYAVSDAVLRASGNVPAAKTEKTAKAEKELEKLAAREKQIKEQIGGATINRAKLLAQKRAELKQARQKRDDAINAEIAKLKTKKANQATIVKELKAQLANAKKKKNKASASAIELTLIVAESKLDEINAELYKANGRLAKSYADYKAAYDRLTNLDEAMRKILDMNAATESKIKDQKADFKTVKAEFDACLKSKDFLAAERKMGTLVFIQTGVNDNYALILDIKLKVKSDYYEQIVNYKIN